MSFAQAIGLTGSSMLQRYRSPSVFFWLGEEGSEAIETFFPERTAFVDPFFGDRKAFGFDAAGADAADFFGVHQAAFFEDLHVLDNGGESDVERFCQMRDGDGAFAEFFDDGAAGGIAERMKNAVDCDLLRMHALCLSLSAAN